MFYYPVRTNKEKKEVKKLSYVLLCGRTTTGGVFSCRSEGVRLFSSVISVTSRCDQQRSISKRARKIQIRLVKETSKDDYQSYRPRVRLVVVDKKA